jgi:membrane protein implicated in regulation of membrane protease activity
MTHALTMWLAADPSPAVANPGWLTWLTPPVATVCAAFIAVIGALIAYAGVTKTTRTTRRENRRAENLAVLEQAFAAVHALSRAIERVNKPSDPLYAPNESKQ